MKTITRLWSLIVATFLATPGAQPAGFVYENTAEFTATGDFNSDGREDLVIVDRATGNYRVGFQRSDGNYDWLAPRASGVEQVTGFSVGRLIDTGVDTLVFTAPAANRLNVCDARPTATGVPRPVYPAGVGPNAVVAIDIGGIGNTVFEDLLSATRLNSADPPGSAHGLHAIRNDGANHSTLASVALSAPAARGNRVVLKLGLAPRAGFLFGETGGDTFRAYNVAGGTLTVFSLATGLPSGADYVTGHFANSPLAQFLFYQPGAAGGSVALRQVTEPVPGSLGFAAAPGFSFGVPVRQMFVVPSAQGGRLLVLFGAGESAGCYTFDGMNPPALLQEFTPAAGEHFSGVCPLADGRFVMLSGAIGATASARFENFSFDGTQYVAGATGVLPAHRSGSGLANLFEFQNEPFVSVAPGLLRVLNAADWTSAFRPALLPQLWLSVETFGGASAGLGNLTTTNLGAVTGGAQHGLVNQHANSISLFSVARPLGETVAEVTIAPAPGQYAKSVEVTLKTTTPGAVLYYRRNNETGWTPYAAKIPLVADTTLHYYARLASGNRQSAIQQATYQFTAPPAALDSDSDGVPDFVEIGQGLDPRQSGPDADGDGWSDLDELLAGSQPGNPNSQPPAGYRRLETQAAFDLIVTLRPIDGTLGQLTVARAGSAVRAYSLSGNLLADTTNQVLNLTGVINPAALLSNLVQEAAIPFTVVATDPHFEIDTPATDRRIGRELIGLVRSPASSPAFNVNHLYGGAGIVAESLSWISAAQIARAALSRDQIIRQLDHGDTLTALLFERQVDNLFQAQGQIELAGLTLFSFRANDAGKPSPTRAQLLALEYADANGHPGFSLGAIYAAITDANHDGGLFDLSGLRAVARDIYRISSALNNGAPNAYASPVQVLRDFLRAGVLPEGYLLQTAVGLAQRQTAFASVNTFLAALASRPLASLTPLTRADTFAGGCTVLDSLSHGAVSLLHRGGWSYPWPLGFALPANTPLQVVGYTDVAAAACPGIALEVVSIALDFSAIGVPSAIDTDGDQLPDALELLVFGSLAPSLPALELLPSLGGQFRLCWQWPARHSERVQFDVLATSDLAAPFQSAELVPIEVAPGRFEIALPPDGPGRRFYRLGVGLK